MLKSMKQRGFTLIELLVVIAIIGILSSVVLASLNSAREKSRDARRQTDLQQISLALELYYDDNGSYPTTANFPGDLEPDYMTDVPQDPQGNDYQYDAEDSNQSSFCLGTTLEDSNSIPDNNDSDCVDGSGDPDIGSSYNYAVSP